MLSKTLYRLLMLSIVPAILFACEKWDAPEGFEASGMLARVENEKGELIARYDYKNGLLVKSRQVVEFSLNMAEMKYNYEYDNNGLLTKKSGFEPGNMIMSSILGAADKDVDYAYEYENGKFNRLTIKYELNEFPDYDYSSTAEYFYPEENVVLQVNNPYAEDLSGVYETEYHFNSKGNIDKIYHYYYEDESNERKLNSYSEMEYDNKPAPLSFEPGPRSKNNMLKQVFYYTNGSSSYTIEYEYTYNKNGYPETSREIMPNGTIKNRSYFYMKK